MTRRQHLGIAVAAGLVSGLVVLGVGGRIAMRIVAYTTPEPEELTLTGTLLVIGIGAGWGAITAPILVLLQGTAIREHRWLGVGFGGVVFALALLAPLVALAFGERLVAPVTFIVVSGVLFPALFLAHGAATVWLARRWALPLSRLRRPAERSDTRARASSSAPPSPDR